ncbi:actin-associated protein FAM107A [Lampris incognitus]|uniref:actin-associated protein FAM107A n=1 Tax=Lampris incognitus TaxID=2546036 RepID=UPI0024B556F8|nr:actin-associated protein FAM107A [Lampris incognitus]
MKPAQELQALPPQGQDEEENGNLIRPKKLPHPLTSSKSHQQLHKELKMTHNRGVCKEKKTELQLVLERRNCEQRLKKRRHQEETQRSRSPLQQELLKRQQRLDKLERDQRDRPEDPEFLRVKERLRRTTTLDMGGKDV